MSLSHRYLKFKIGDKNFNISPIRVSRKHFTDSKFYVKLYFSSQLTLHPLIQNFHRAVLPNKNFYLH